jgi:hypothetical protein
MMSIIYMYFFQAMVLIAGLDDLIALRNIGKSSQSL